MNDIHIENCVFLYRLEANAYFYIYWSKTYVDFQHLVYIEMWGSDTQNSSTQMNDIPRIPINDILRSDI